MGQKFLKGVLDLSTESLWASVDQGAAKLRAVKVKGWKKILSIYPPCTMHGRSHFDTQTMVLSSEFDVTQLCSPLTYIRLAGFLR